MISGRTIGQDGKPLESPTPTLFRTLMVIIWPDLNVDVDRSIMRPVPLDTCNHVIPLSVNVEPTEIASRLIADVQLDDGFGLRPGAAATDLMVNFFLPSLRRKVSSASRHQ